MLADGIKYQRPTLMNQEQVYMTSSYIVDMTL